MLQKTTVPCVDDLMYDPENSRLATETPSNSGPTINPDISGRAMERSSSSKSMPNAEISRWASKGSSSSESTVGWKTAHESFSDNIGGASVYSRNVLV